MALEKHYDSEGDVLYLSVREASFSDAFKQRDGLLIDVDRENKEVIGVTVLNYEEKFRKLPDLSWVRTLQLPHALTDFLTERSAPPMD